ncbi:MAG: PepSY domain-containing protein [Acidobacteria bacterium]|nr:PepSY domain-containing protein [Acidobacteriota bacterium]
MTALMHWLDWRRWIVYTHRWLGIAGGVLFVAWFVSGVVMMYVRMPGMANEERLARAPALDLSTATVSPLEAARAVGLVPDEAASLGRLTRPGVETTAQTLAAEISIDRVRVARLGDRPVYRFGTGRNETVVYADTPEILGLIDRAQAEAIARRYAPASTGRMRYDAYMTEPDQWTLQARGLMPIHRFALDDADATRVYVSALSGDVVLRTTRAERFWGYLGPVTHWVYFTPLRTHGSVWSEFIIWSSLIGCVMCLTGLVWGVWRYSPMRRFRLRRVPSQSPYAGLMKWHHYTGLVFGVITLTWTYSGLLSMGPFNWFESPGMTAAQREAYTGGPLRVDLLTLDGMRASLAALEHALGSSPKELEATQFRGEPFWLAYRAPLAAEAAQWMHVGLWPRAPRPRLEHRSVSAVDPAAGTFARFDEPRFGRESMLEIAHEVMPGVPLHDALWLQAYDAHYYDLRGGRPLPVLRVRFADAARTWLYLDPARGAIVQKMDDTRRLRRWLYQGLHSLDVPFLYYKRPLWDVVVIVLSIGGVALSATTLLPGFRRLRRRVASGFGRTATGFGLQAVDRHPQSKVRSPQPVRTRPAATPAPSAE